MKHSIGALIVVLIAVIVSSAVSLYLWVELTKLCVWLGRYTWP